MDTVLKHIVIELIAGGDGDQKMVRQVVSALSEAGVQTVDDLLLLDEVPGFNLVQRRRLFLTQQLYNREIGEERHKWLQTSARDLRRMATAVPRERSTPLLSHAAQEHFEHEVFKAKFGRVALGFALLACLGVGAYGMTQNYRLLILPAMFITLVASIFLCAIIGLMLEVGVCMGCCTEACLINPCP